MSETVFVTNRSENRLVITYAYKEYVFEVDKTTEVPLECAQFVFGYQMQDKASQLVRLGWLRMSNELEPALEKLSKFQVTAERPETNRSLPSAVGVVPLHVEKRAGGKVNQRVA